ncbi:hypothetical protein OS493_006904 [Desmophyllum pertusum]|uniref:Uncharacterized protein n=1 Tax=Desmophyllum pertusum TaxID=174260 RepID=A0A9W9ZSW2_9CNID|nr:hypothetical protein OS493_006904 [Desmophyllum pertusum]
MALLHTLSNLPPTCGDICLQVLDQMIAKKNFLFSTDCYHSESIKAQETETRQLGEDPSSWTSYAETIRLQDVEVQEIPTIYSNQEETDTRVVLYLHYAVSLGYKNAVNPDA